MTTTLLDSNVLLDIVEEDPTWYGWSSEAMAVAADHGTLVINPVIYAEVSIGYARDARRYRTYFPTVRVIAPS